MTQVIAAVVVTHNRLDKLERTLDRLLAEDIDHLVVVNNASTDGTQDYLSSLDNDRLHIVHLTENTGGAGGFEVGLKEALNAFEPDWFVIMDDDAYPRQGAISSFRNSDLQDTSIVAASVYLKTGEIAEMNRPWVNPFRSIGSFFRAVSQGRAGYHIHDEAYARSTPTRVDGASFVGLFLSHDVLKDMGFPDGRLFIYGDDVIYTLQATKLGSKICFDPQIEFEHDCETGSTDGVFSPLWKNYYRFRNQIFVYRLAAGPVLAGPVILAQLLRWRLWSRNLPRTERKVYLRIMWMAVQDAMRRNLDRKHSDILELSHVA